MSRKLELVLSVGLLLGAADVARPADAPSTQTLIEQATHGDAAAQVSLAVRYRDGKGVERDYAQAMRWAHMAADQGDPAALDFVGYMYFRGVGVKHNADVAVGYFKAAADKFAAGAWNLGQCYFAALGVEQDVPKALESWKKAAAMGHGRAAAVAAMTYLAGEGVPPDRDQARVLADRAVELNDPSGLVLRGEMHFQAGEIDKARELWAKVAKMNPTRPTSNPEQPSGEMASQQGADLIRLLDYRQRKPQLGKLGLVNVHHVLQGWNNCGATSCAMFARTLGKNVGGWDYKRFCNSPLGTGTDWGDLIKASEKADLRWKLVTFTPDDDGFEKATSFARSEIDAGRALVVDFKYIGPQYPGGEAGHTLLLAGYIAEENLYILCNPAIPTPGLMLISAADLKHYWRSDHYGKLSHNVLSRPAIVVDSGR
jgi:TPR repeat protein